VYYCTRLIYLRFCLCMCGIRNSIKNGINKQLQTFWTVYKGLIPTSCIKVVLFSPLCFFVVHVVSAKKRINEADKEMELSKGKVFVVVGGVVVEHMQYER